MIARLCASSIFLLSLALTGCLLAAWHLRETAWIVVPVALLLGVHALVLAFELTLQRWGARRQGEPDPIPLSAIPRIVVREMISGWRVFAWEQPFRRGIHPDALGPGADGAGVVLIHGLFCNRGVWNRWMPVLRDRGIRFVAVDLEPAFGSIDDYPPLIEAAVRRLTDVTGRAPVVVGHSMGGIVARAWMDRYDADARVAHVVTIGSPHHGTRLASFARSVNARQMALGSDWLATLAAREPPGRASRFTCFHSESDNVIVPWTSARLAGADNRHVREQSHLALLDAPAVLADVMRLVAETRVPRSTQSPGSTAPASISGSRRTSA